jgi:hypothetical protein
MTLFGKSLFETVMAGIDARKGDEEEDGDPTEPVIRGLNAGFVGRSFQYRDDEDSDPMQLFEPFLTEHVATPPPESRAPEPPLPEVPDWIDRLSPEDVAADLELGAGLTRLQLRAKRRQFARENHPDGVAPFAHQAATQRMMIANQLIDKALKSAKS